MDAVVISLTEVKEMGFLPSVVNHYMSWLQKGDYYTVEIMTRSLKIFPEKKIRKALNVLCEHGYAERRRDSITSVFKYYHIRRG